jgi:hypothetical protein
VNRVSSFATLLASSCSLRSLVLDHIQENEVKVINAAAVNLTSLLLLAIPKSEGPTSFRGLSQLLSTVGLFTERYPRRQDQMLHCLEPFTTGYDEDSRCSRRLCSVLDDLPSLTRINGESSQRRIRDMRRSIRSHANPVRAFHNNIG